MEKSNLHNKCVLVVEDERPLAKVIALKLGNSGFDVVTARTAEQAWNYLEEVERVDAIWLDHYLLGKDNGLDIVTKLKEATSKWKKVPVFVVSNTASHDKIQSYMHLGINKYYVKSNHRLEDIINDIKSSLVETSEA